MTTTDPFAEAAPPPHHKHCLLVVDDEPEVCNAVYHLLHRRYEVLRAHSASEAIGLLGQYEVEIILTDQRMPDVTGVEMLARIRTKYPEAIRLLFTGYCDYGAVVDAINQGHIYGFLSKPWQPDELEAAVDAAAVEFHRLSRSIAELASCRQRVAELEAEIRALRARLGDSDR